MGLGDFLQKQTENPGASWSLASLFLPPLPCCHGRGAWVCWWAATEVFGVWEEKQGSNTLSVPWLLRHQLTVLSAFPGLWEELIVPFLGVGRLWKGLASEVP